MSWRHCSLAAACALMLVVLSHSPAQALAHRFIEDFTSQQYCDTLNTTAWWDTSAGELKLHPFEVALSGSCMTYEALGVAVSGDLAFVADGLDGFRVIDISEPANPALLGHAEGVVGAGVAVWGDLAFVADDLPFRQCLYVIDVSDPTTPVQIFQVYEEFACHGVVVAGDQAFLAAGDYGLVVIDISDPAYPPPHGSNCDTPGYAFGVAVSGDHAFVADGDSGLQVIDISDPTNPALLGGCDTPGDAHGVVVAGNHAFVADGGSGLQVIDISDPANPALLGSYDTPGCANGVAVSGDHVFVADGDSGLQMIDISDPTNPALLGGYDTPGCAHGVAVSGDHAFVADGGSGLQAIDISNPTPAALTGSRDTAGSARQVAVSGDHAFVADGDSGLQVIDISDPTAPVLVGNCEPLPGPGHRAAVGTAVSGDLAFVVDAMELQVIDISDPTNPFTLGVGPNSVIGERVAVSGDYAFMCGGAGFEVIDISDPTNPVHLGMLGTSGCDDCGVAVAGDNAFMAGDCGFLAIDISDPSYLSLLSELPLGMCNDVAVSGDLALVVHALSGLMVFDISDPTLPALLGSYDTPGYAHGVAVSGDRAFVANGDYGLQVIDISDPANPTLAGSYDTPGYANGIAISGDHAFVADGDGGLQVIQVFQSEVDMDNNLGRSLVVDTSDDIIVRACLTSTQTETVTWELSADGGDHWLGIAPDGAWQRVVAPGSNLLWRSEHVWAAPGVNPGVTRLDIGWLGQAAAIDSIVDVPDDQGRSVNLSFSRSGYDYLDETEFPLVGYAIYRRLDDGSLAKQIRHLPAIPTDEALASPQFASFGPDRVRRLEDRTFIVSGDRSATSTLPPGVWEGVGWVLPTQSDTYTTRVHTLADSTASGPAWSVFVVAAHTTTPSVWFVCEPDSGYSVDNIPPGVPEAVSAAYAASGVTLDWDDAPESDFQYYRVYRDTDFGFSPSPDNLVQETAVSTWNDPTPNPWGYFYKITALDRSGNESEAGSPSSVSGVQDGAVPARTELFGAVPNPFNPTTTLTFDLAAAGPVRLNVYDPAGRLVRVLMDERLAAGPHAVVWDGRDAAGRVAAAGVYLYRLRAGDCVATRRMTLVK